MTHTPCNGGKGGPGALRRSGRAGSRPSPYSFPSIPPPAPVEKTVGKGGDQARSNSRGRKRPREKAEEGAASRLEKQERKATRSRSHGRKKSSAPPPPLPQANTSARRAPTSSTPMATGSKAGTVAAIKTAAKEAAA
ncbi:hypothetical protein CLOM_g14928 [Closterium sp. NIES-68]|nr:hypothetical protein CLOM_g14928 [Closterium sp. NIES-68]